MRLPILFLLLCLEIPTAGGVPLRRPFADPIGVNYGFDHNGSAAGCQDFACGAVCYNEHTGTDFPLPMGTPVFAGADGVVTQIYYSCPSTGALGNTCGNGCGNQVYIDHGDGTRSWFCHFRQDGVEVAVGQAVTCGQLVGYSGSSGSSTGPHLHVGFSVGGVRTDPFGGACSQATSYWTDQGTAPRPIPSDQCFYACAAEGECTPWQSQTQDCCDCGTQTRTCTTDCAWGEWSACAGPDPDGGQTACETGEGGHCAEGRVRCRDGCVACVRLLEPLPEVCNLLDEDCDGTADNGFPETLGDPAPPWSARLTEFGGPAAVRPGQRFSGWALFENTGTETWPAGAVRLQLSEETAAGAVDWVPQNWLGDGVAAILDLDVPPGQRALLPWEFQAPGTETAAPLVADLVLASEAGGVFRCPHPQVEVRVEWITGLDDPDAKPTFTAADGCSCRAGKARPGADSTLPPLSLLLLLFVLHRRRSSNRRSRPVLRVVKCK